MSATHIAGYSVVRRLRGGGITDLYVALDENQNRVVVGLLKEEYARNWRMRRAFIRGADIQGQLDHPNIVRLLDSGKWASTRYIVLEYIEGPRLRDLIAHRKPLLTERVFDLIRQLARAITHVHEQGFLHLDIKPENVLIREPGEVLIIDFDLALPRKPKPFKVRDIPGTPAYIAPEALIQNLVDERYDIYSFGVTCYEMLCYHKPYDGNSMEELRAAQVNPRVKPTPLRRYTSKVTAALERVILKCLAKDPEQRYPSMSLVLRDLEGIT
jgi:serine/threonine-protein kinase